MLKNPFFYVSLDEFVQTKMLGKAQSGQEQKKNPVSEKCKQRANHLCILGPALTLQWY